MNADEFNEETRRERLEEERIGRTLEDEIEDRESDIRDLDKIIADQLQENARLVSTNNLLRRLLRTERVELHRLREEHAAGVRIVLQLKAKRPMLDPDFIRWMDAHDRTELAK